MPQPPQRPLSTTDIRLGANIARAPSKKPTLASKSRLSVDTASQKATAAFVRRTLCANAVRGAGHDASRPIEELLPPLTSSNEIDFELYALIAIIVKEAVLSWYTKITQDHVFIDEIVRIIAHCSLAIEQRVRDVDLHLLLLDELPRLLDDHIVAYRTACRYSSDKTSAGPSREVYHVLQPHPALEPVPDDGNTATITEQQASEEAWRQLLVQGVLAALLPTEDLQSDCLRALVTEIFSEMILANAVCGRACESWVLWEGIAKVAQATAGEASQQRDTALKVDKPPDISATQQATSQAQRQFDKRTGFRFAVHASVHKMVGLLWIVMQHAILGYTLLRTCLSILRSTSIAPTSSRDTGEKHKTQVRNIEGKTLIRQPTAAAPIVEMSLWRMLSHFVELEQRMPWLSGMLSLLQRGLVTGPGRVADTGGSIDRFLARQIDTRVLKRDPHHVAQLLCTLRTSAFPNNSIAPPRTIPQGSEVLELRTAAARAIVNAVPKSLLAVYFGRSYANGAGETGEEGEKKHEDMSHWISQVESWLDIFEDSYLNKHLVIKIVDLLVVKIVPELGEMGVEALLSERIGVI